jgi:S-formylglutathione hydrolase
MSTNADVKKLSEAKCHGGVYYKYEHFSQSTQTQMKFSVYLPPQATEGKVPALYFLSGLTCNEDNFIQKAGAIPHAARLGLALICPDTSPRGTDLPDEHTDWDFGSGAGFYVDATEAPWSAHYNMYSYVTQELPGLIATLLPVSAKKSVFGHSMGGHGALVVALRNSEQYQSVSAFAPIANPVDCPWGHKCFGNYLGSDRTTWNAYDATELVKTYTGRPLEILIDQGSADGFLENQLKLDSLEAAVADNPLITLSAHRRDGYDHSYWFISTFIDEHMTFHARALNLN